MCSNILLESYNCFVLILLFAMVAMVIPTPVTDGNSFSPILSPSHPHLSPSLIPLSHSFSPTFLNLLISLSHSVSFSLPLSHTPPLSKSLSLTLSLPLFLNPSLPPSLFCLTVTVGGAAGLHKAIILSCSAHTISHTQTHAHWQRHAHAWTSLCSCTAHAALVPVTQHDLSIVQKYNMSWHVEVLTLKNRIKQSICSTPFPPPKKAT